MDSRQAGEILAYLSAAWPRYELHEETIRVWIDQLQAVDFEAAQVAARRIVAEDDWFPAVSRLKALCRVAGVSRNRSGCDLCHRGFVEKSSGEVVICPNCRHNAYSQTEIRALETSAESFDWRQGISDTRKRLGEKNDQRQHSDSA